jgi:hypothetical protein
VDDTIFNLSMLMADQGFAKREKAQKTQFAFFSKGRIDYTPHFEHIEKLLQAAEEKRICLVRYKASGRDEAREHRFAPDRMVSMNNALYVAGATVTEDFKEVRHPVNLAIQRLTDVILTERNFSFSLPEIEANSFGLPWHEPKTFRIRFKKGKAADYVRERIWAEEQIIEDTEDGGLLLELSTRSEPELLAWVRSFGEEARMEPFPSLIQPSSLKERSDV